MLSATSTRDLNQAARSASKYLKELGFELPHSKALDLVARLVGKPQHMAAQAGLLASDTTTTSSSNAAVPQQVVRAVRQVVFGAEMPVDAAGRVRVAKAYLDQLYDVTNSAVEAAAAAQASAPAKPDSANAVIEDLCKVLINRDVEEALYDVGISDAANAALARATPYVEDRLLLDFPLDALSQAYDDLPTSVDEEEFVQGHGNWSLSQDECTQAKRLAEALYAAKRNRAAEQQALSEEDLARLCAQVELATGESGEVVRDIGRRHLNDEDEVLRQLRSRFGINPTMGPWLISNDGEKGFWCNDFGWTSSRMAASGFDEETMRSMPVQKLAARFGSYSRWVRFDEAFDYPADDKEPSSQG